MEEFARAWVFFCGVDSSVSIAPSGKGDDPGRGFCVAMPLLLVLEKVARVGVVASSIIDCAGAGSD